LENKLLTTFCISNDRESNNYQKQKEKKMKYRVHRLEVRSDNMQEKLEQFLGKLDGDIISIIPNVRPTFMGMGATAKIDFLLVVEKAK